MNSHLDKNIFQSSAQIEITNSLSKQIVWSSGFINTQASTIKYTGNPQALVLNSKYSWRVQWRDNHNHLSPWSSEAFFYTPASDNVWNQTQWIGGNFALLRRTFTLESGSISLDSPIFTYISGLGFFQLFINGQRVDTDKLNGAWTSYNVRSIYYTFEVQSYLKEGENVIGVILGPGWRDLSAFPVQWKANECADKNELLLRLALIHAESGLLIRGSDSSWSGSIQTPFQQASIYNGEIYDSRLEQIGWNSPGYIPCNWKNVPIIDCFNPKLSPLLFPGISTEGIQHPKSINQLNSISKVIDFGSNLSGWVKISVKGSSGSNVTIKYAEGKK